MFYDINNFHFLLPFVKNANEISSEYEKACLSVPELKNFFNSGMPPVYSHFDYWIKESGFDPEQIGYDARGEGPVGGFPLYKKGFPIKWMSVPDIFPLTHQLLMGVENINFAQFSIMSPNSHILPHKHTAEGYIFHICLSDLDGDSFFYCGNQTIKISRRGDSFLFMPKDTHSSKNESKSFRVNLMFDFRPK